MISQSHHRQARWADAGGAGGPLQGAPAAGQGQAASASGRGPTGGSLGMHNQWQKSIEILESKDFRLCFFGF